MKLLRLGLALGRRMRGLHGELSAKAKGVDYDLPQLPPPLRRVTHLGFAPFGLTLALTGALRQTALGPE
jgi:hypothetical protein